MRLSSVYSSRFHNVKTFERFLNSIFSSCFFSMMSLFKGMFLKTHSWNERLNPFSFSVFANFGGGILVNTKAYGDQFSRHGDVPTLHRISGMDAEALHKKALELFRKVL